MTFWSDGGGGSWAATLIFVGIAGWLGGGVAQELTGGGFEDPDAESAQAAAALEEVFETGDPNVVILVTAAGGDVDDPAAAEAGMALTSALSQIEGVTDVASYWALGSAPPLRSDDGSQALVLARMDEDDEAVADSVRDLVASSSEEPITVEMGGASEVFREIQETVENDLIRAESIAFPITLALLVLVFGSLVAASLPLVVGGIAIIGTFLALSLINQVTDVSIFALNLTTALGLGLGIDYSLFVVSRFREELGPRAVYARCRSGDGSHRGEDGGIQRPDRRHLAGSTRRLPPRLSPLVRLRRGRRGAHRRDHRGRGAPGTPRRSRSQGQQPADLPPAASGR